MRHTVLFALSFLAVACGGSSDVPTASTSSVGAPSGGSGGSATSGSTAGNATAGASTGGTGAAGQKATGGSAGAGGSSASGGHATAGGGGASGASGHAGSAGFAAGGGSAGAAGASGAAGAAGAAMCPPYPGPASGTACDPGQVCDYYSGACGPICNCPNGTWECAEPGGPPCGFCQAGLLCMPGQTCTVADGTCTTTCGCDANGTYACTKACGSGAACGGPNDPPCGATEWCQDPSGNCGPGTCVARPTSCPATQQDTACGCDGQPYDNACAAHLAGVDTSADSSKCAAQCPTSPPATGDPCSPNGEMCTYPINDPCCPLSIVATCENGTWFVPVPDCTQMACPPSPPQNGDACTGCTGPCAWDLCGGGDVTISATCNAGTWSVVSTPCNTTCGPNGLTCAPGEICVEQQGGAGSSWGCQANPCGSAPVDCSCAGSLCGPNDTCSAPAAGQLVCSCQTCP